MKHILHVEERTVGNELADGADEKWERIWAEYFSIEPLTGREYIQAQQVQSDVSHKLRCVFHKDTAGRTDYRLTAGADKDNPTRVFNVKSVVNVKEMNRELEWMATEV
jgi:head-tail adaptor